LFLPIATLQVLGRQPGRTTDLGFAEDRGFFGDSSPKPLLVSRVTGQPIQSHIIYPIVVYAQACVHQGIFIIILTLVHID
jgi:hypothetical protein